MAEYLKFPPNVRVEGKAKFSSVKPTETKFGEKWLFTLEDVDGTGEERSGTLSQALAEQLTDVKVGDHILIMKQDAGTGAIDIRWKVAVNGAVVEEGSTSPLPRLEDSGGGNSGGSSSGRSEGATSITVLSLAEMGTLMTECLVIASGVGEDLGNRINAEVGPEDIRSIGISLFIEANRQGIRPHSIESTAADVGNDPFGTEAPPPPTEDDDSFLPF